MIAKGDVARHLSGQVADRRLDPETVPVRQGQRRHRAAEHLGGQRDERIELRFRLAVEQRMRLERGQAAFLVERRGDGKGASIMMCGP
ncbi:hypothetical protein GCM10020258_26580 [Sphingomonas yabuuchiae]